MYSYGRASSSIPWVSLIMAVGVIALMIAAQWRLFTKAGEPGWKSIVPIYGAYTLYKLVWTPGAFAVFAALSAASALAQRIPAVALLVSLGMVVIGVITAVKTAHAYGKSGGFAVGLILLPVIFYPVLAFGDSRYVGPAGAGDAGTIGEDGAQVDGRSRNDLVWIAAAIFGVAALAVVGYRLVSCFYELQRGSRFTGMRAFSYVFSNPRVLGSILPTLLMRLADLALAVALGFAGAAAGRSKARPFVAGFGLLLAILPLFAWESLFLSLHWMSVVDGGLLAYVLHALPWAGLSLFAGAMLAPAWRESSSGAALAAPALMLLSGVSSVGMMTVNLRNLDSTIYNMGLVMYNLSPAACVEVIRGLITLVIAAGGIAMLAVLLRGHRRGIAPSAQGGALSAALVAGLIPLGLAAALLATGSPNEITEAYCSRALPTSAIEFGGALLLGFGLYFSLYCLIGSFDPDSPLPLGLTIVLALSLGAFSIVGFLLAQSTRLMNTVIPVVVNGLVDPLSLTFAFVLALLRPRKTGARVFLALAAACFAAGRCATGLIGSRLYLMSGMDVGKWALMILQRGFGVKGSIGGVIGGLLAVCGLPAALSALFSLMGSGRDSA